MRSTRQQSHESNYRDSSVQTRVPLEQVKHFRLSLAEHPDIDMKMGAGLSHAISEFSAPPPTVSHTAQPSGFQVQPVERTIATTRVFQGLLTCLPLQDLRGK